MDTYAKKEEDTTMSNRLTIPEGDLPATMPSTFPLFPKLPLELRLKIFHHATDSWEPQLFHIEINFSSITRSSSSADGTLNGTPPEKSVREMSFSVVKSDNDEHDASARNLGLSQAHSELRGIWLKSRPFELPVKGEGSEGSKAVLRLTKEDVVYFGRSYTNTLNA